MYSRNNIQNPKSYQLHTETPSSQSNKNYLNYINFQTNSGYKTSLRDIPKQPEQTATYSINVNQQPKTFNNHSNPINRSPYLGNNIEARRQSERPYSRNSANKESVALRQSHQIVRDNNQYLKNSSKTSHGFNRKNSDLQKSGKPSYEASSQENYLNSPNMASKTVDFGSIKQKKNLESSTTLDSDELKQKINYLQVIQQSLEQFENSRSPVDLRRLNQDNRLLMLEVFDEIGRLKEEKSRRNVSDGVSESDNISEDVYSIDDRSDNRSNSMSRRSRYRQNLSRSREKIKAKQKQIEHERKLNQKLKAQYDAEMKKSIQNGPSQLEKLCASIQKQEEQIAKATALNEEIASKLTQLPFHHEWKIMCGEAEGAKRARIKIEEELKKRKEKLSESINGSSKTPIRSEQTAVNKKQEQKEQQGSEPKKGPMSNLKIPPSPASRGLVTSQHSSGNRMSQENSSKQLGSQVRSKSSNRFNTSN